MNKKKNKTDPKNSDFKDAIISLLRTVFDPEIPVNIVDLGLIYDIKIIGKKNKQDINIKMTLTAPGCGMGPSIAQD
ncbi:MAG TPA: putative Fe-S cluster assembly protein SufT, partial [Alphaproteobacteria bacterium]|nr:putative Fe-S cluster assembly protein SufT [Alphaproteobacteria bacterium]